MNRKHHTEFYALISEVDEKIAANTPLPKEAWLTIAIRERALALAAWESLGPHETVSINHARAARMVFTISGQQWLVYRGL